MGGAMYFLLFGLAAIFLFAGANVLPTGHRNAVSVERALDDAQQTMTDYISIFPGFPVPSYCAHPIVLRRMQEILASGRAETIDTAFDVLKNDLLAMNASVTVDQETYSEIMTIKPMFLVRA